MTAGARAHALDLLVVGPGRPLEAPGVVPVVSDDVATAARRLTDGGVRCALLLRHDQLVDDLEVLAARCPETAILVDRDARDWAQDAELLLRGAQDCLDVTGPLEDLAAIARRAIARQAMLARSRRRVIDADVQADALERELARLREVGTLGVSAPPLAERMPARSAEAASAYADVVVASLENALEHGEPRATPRLRDLAADLVRLDCGPRDAVAIHTEAARTIAETVDAVDISLYLDEMRLVLVALLGLMASEYRRRLVQVLEPTGAEPGPDAPSARFRLFVSGSGPRTRTTRANLERLCREAYGDRFAVEVVDVEEQPEAAERSLVLVTPTLDRLHPQPARRLTGDLSSEDKVRLALDLPLSTENA